MGKLIHGIENVDRKMGTIMKKLKEGQIDGYDIVELCIIRVTINFLEVDGLKLLNETKNRQTFKVIKNQIKALRFLQGAREELIEQAKAKMKMSSF